MTNRDPYDYPVVPDPRPKEVVDPRKNWAEPFPEDWARQKAEFAEGTPAPMELPDSGRERQRGDSKSEGFGFSPSGVENGNICVLNDRGAHLRLAKNCPHIDLTADFDEIHVPTYNAVHRRGE
jgi:hypothetical protein